VKIERATRHSRHYIPELFSACTRTFPADLYGGNGSGEFGKFYNLDVTVIPTNRPLSRIDSTCLPQTQKMKVEAVVNGICGRQLSLPTAFANITTGPARASEQRAPSTSPSQRRLAENKERSPQVLNSSSTNANLASSHIRAQGRGTRRDEHGGALHDDFARRHPTNDAAIIFLK